MKTEIATCRKHGIPLVQFCPACRGSSRSQRKKKSSAENGRLGGRPEKRYRRGLLSLTARQWAARWKVSVAVARHRLLHPQDASAYPEQGREQGSERPVHDEEGLVLSLRVKH